jgi:hypothetical protein
MNRRYRAPDGLDWRDPNMPVIRRYTMGNGEVREVVDPDYERRYREYLLSTTIHPIEPERKP